MATCAGLSSTPTHQSTLLRDFSLGFNVLSKQMLSRGKGIFLHTLLSVLIDSPSLTAYQATHIHVTALYRHLCFLKSLGTNGLFERFFFLFFFFKKSMNSNVNKNNNQEYGFFSSLAITSNQRDLSGHFHFRITNVVPLV